LTHKSPKEYVAQVSANILNIAGRISNYTLGNRKCNKNELGCSGRWFMVFIAPFNNISAILWQSVLLVEETGVP
jgi:hypothetical protein